MFETESTGRGRPSSKTSKLARATLITLATTLIAGCESVVPGSSQNQWEDLPAALTEPPEVTDFLTPWKDSLQQSDRERIENERRLLDSYAPANVRLAP